MQRTEHVQQMAAYNALMNERLYEAARSIPDEELAAQRSAFFCFDPGHTPGQATPLLQQAGVDVGVTDLLALIADAP